MSRIPHKQFFDPLCARTVGVVTRHLLADERVKGLYVTGLSVDYEKPCLARHAHVELG
jgi:hypothetical protein